MCGPSIEIVEVPGNHFSMFDEPNVTTLAERIDRTLSAGAYGDFASTSSA
jgi:thioesterase domain-containing protein